MAVWSRVGLQELVVGTAVIVDSGVSLEVVTALGMGVALIL